MNQKQKVMGEGENKNRKRHIDDGKCQGFGRTDFALLFALYFPLFSFSDLSHPPRSFVGNEGEGSSH
jgi:hypothetical protein